MILKTSMLGQIYEFKDVKDVLAKASEKKSGDELAGVAAESKLQRIAAKEVLGQLTVGDLRENPAVPYEEDSVTRIIQDDIDEDVYKEIKGKTIQEMREWILDDATDNDKIMRASKGLTSEAIAAISKIMGNMDLILAGSKMHITATCNTTIGTENVLAARLQPNHPVDDVEGVTASTLEGLSYGSGDAVIGLNPAIDTVDSTLAIWKTLGDIRDKYEIPTQTCVLSHVTTQMEALRSGQGSADLCFQSIAGSKAAMSAFGVTTGMLEEAEALFKEKGHAKGPNVMYFETGQGSELSSCLAYLGLKKNYPDMHRPYVAPGGKFGCWFTIVVYIFMLIFADKAALATSGVVTVAAVIYWAVFTRKHENKIPTIEEEIGVLEEPSPEEKAKMDKEYNIWKIGTVIATIIALGIYIIPVIF